MSKMKMVVKLNMTNGKERAKAMKLAVGFPGVQSASIDGKEKNELIIVGDGLDATNITTVLRKGKPKRIPLLGCFGPLIPTKGMGVVELVSFGEVKEEKKEKEKEKKKEKDGDKKPDPYVYPNIYTPVVEVWEYQPKFSPWNLW